MNFDQMLYVMELADSDVLARVDSSTLIIAAGFDDRAYELCKRYDESGVRIDTLVVFVFDEDIIAASEDESYFAYRQRGVGKVIEIRCSLKDPTSSLDGLLNNQDILSGGHLSIDITCFNRPYIFYLLKLLRLRFNILRLEAFYTEPETYLFENGLLNAYHSMSGPLSILEVPGFSGRDSRGEKRLLVILLGFDGDLSREIGEDVSPSITWLVNGFPAYSPKFKDISLIGNDKLMRNDGVEIVYSRASNPFQTYNLLEQAAHRFAPAFLNVAPLGAKPMALGACLFALSHPDTRVVYPFPEKYAGLTSSGVWNCWHYFLPLGE